MPLKMTSRGRSAQLALHRIALLLALACLWMSSGATLRHTDDLSEYRTYAAGQAVLHHSTPTPPSVPCAAHEWMNAWQTFHTAFLAVVYCPVFLATLRQTPLAVLHLGGFDYVSLRGPPSLLS